MKGLKSAGYTEISQRGSHIKLKGLRAGYLRTVIVPNHKEIARGTFGSILRQAGITQAEFDDLL